MSGFVAIDLSQLPPPQLIEALDFESYAAATLADFKTRWPEFTVALESEPVVKLIQAFAYRETLLRNRVNKTALAVLLPFARGSDLDHLGSRLQVRRMALGAEPRSYLTNPEDWEDDERYRRRVALAPEALSVAGPAGAYEFHALSFDIAIADAHAYATVENARRGEINVVVAGHAGADVSDAVLGGLVNLFAGETLVPATDVPLVRRATVREVDVTQQLVMGRGPDPSLIAATAESAIGAYMAARYKIGHSIYRAGLIAAGKVGGIENVIMPQPAADEICGPDEIAVLGALDVTTMMV